MIEQGLQARRSYKLHHEHAMTYKKAYEINLCCVAPRAHTTEFSFEPHHPTRAKSMVRSPDAALGEELYYIVNLTAIRFPTPGQAHGTRTEQQSCEAFRKKKERKFAGYFCFDCES